MAASGAKAKKKVLPASGSSERTNTRGRSTKTSRRGGPMERQYVGIDLHRRRSVIVRMDESGERLQTVRIDNDPVALGLALAEAGPDPEVRWRRPTAGLLGGGCAAGSRGAGASGASVGAALGC